MNEIMPNLYLGSLEDARSLIRHNPQRIQVVFCCARELHEQYAPYLSKTMILYSMDLEDTMSCPIDRWFSLFHEKVRHHLQQGHICLVHCLAGISRSVTLVCAFLMKEYGWTRDQAYGYVQQRRPQAKPNVHFLRCLDGWERHINL